MPWGRGQLHYHLEGNWYVSVFPRSVFPQIDLCVSWNLYMHLLLFHWIAYGESSEFICKMRCRRTQEDLFIFPLLYIHFHSYVVVTIYPWFISGKMGASCIYFLLTVLLFNCIYEAFLHHQSYLKSHSVAVKKWAVVRSDSFNNATHLRAHCTQIFTYFFKDLFLNNSNHWLNHHQSSLCGINDWFHSDSTQQVTPQPLLLKYFILKSQRLLLHVPWTILLVWTKSSEEYQN